MSSPQINGKSPKISFTTLSITGTESDKIDLAGKTLVGIIVPSGAASTAVSFKSSVSETGTDYAVYKDDDTLYSLTVTAGRQYNIGPVNTASIRWLTVVAGSTESAAEYIAITRVIE